MELLKNRPLATALLCFIASLLSCIFLSYFIGVLILSLCLLAFLFFLFFRQKAWAFLLLLCAFFSFLGNVTGGYYVYRRYEPLNDLIGTTVTVEGTILENTSTTSYSAVYEIRLSSVNGKECHEKAVLSCDYASSLNTGDTFTATVTAEDFSEGLFDEMAYRLSEGCLVKFTLATSDDCTIGERVSTWETKLITLNRNLCYRLRLALGKDAGGLASALLLGNRQFLSDGITLWLQRCGISHLLALSGFHVGLVLAFLSGLMKKWKLRRGVKNCLMAVLLFGYLICTGASYSTCRSVFMMVFLYFSVGVGRQNDGFTTLTVILSLLLTLTPYGAYDVGLWMSFTASAGIVLFTPVVSAKIYARFAKTKWSEDIREKLVSFHSGMVAGLFSICFILPLSATTYGAFSCVSIPCTVLFSLLLTPCMLCSLLVLAFPFLGGLLKYPLLWFVSLSHTISDIPNLLLPLTGEATEIALIFLCAVTLFLTLFRLKNKKWVWLLPICTLVVMATSVVWTNFAKTDLTVQFAPTSGGDVVLYSQKGQGVALYTGDGDSSCVTLLREMMTCEGVTEIDDLIVADCHNMDAHFFSELFSKVRVRRVHYLGNGTETEALVQYREAEYLDRYRVESSQTADDIALFTTTEYFNKTVKNHHSAILFTVSADGKRYTYANSAVLFLEEEDYTDIFEESEAVMMGLPGYSKYIEAKLPLGQTVYYLAETDSKKVSLFAQDGVAFVPCKTKTVTKVGISTD